MFNIVSAASDVVIDECVGILLKNQAALMQQESRVAAQ